MSVSFERPHQVIALLEADPDLGSGLSGEDLRIATHQVRSAVIELEPPGWDPATLQLGAEGSCLGLFLVSGLMLRRVSVAGRSAAELFGPGDLIRPWDIDGDYEPVPITVEWVIARPSRLAVLDEAFALRIGRWPTITDRLISRVVQRARYLALTQAATHHPRVYVRLLIVFWLLAERWGRVGTDGVHVDLPLTHETLAMLVGAHRPTVTIALQRLDRAGLLRRERSDRWLLTAQALESLKSPESVDLMSAVPVAENGDEDAAPLETAP